MDQFPNLLIVDDTETNLILLKRITLHINVNLIAATSGSEALMKTRGIDLALAILDVRMPEMNGYELAEKLNKERMDGKVPVIFLTANSIDETEMFKGYGSGAVDYISKPVSSQILLSKINVFLDLFNYKQTIVGNSALLKKSADDLITLNEILTQREEKILQEQLFTKALLDSIPGIFYLYSYPELRMVAWNKQHETLFGFDANEMKGRHVLDWHLPENKDAVLAALDLFMESGQASIETSLLAKDGRQIPFLLNGVKFERDGEIFLIGTGANVTKRKKAEDELRSSLEQLQQLSQHIEQVRENERVAISRELHDDLGQALTAVKIDLGIIRQKVSDNDVVLRITKVSALVSDTIKTVQRLTSQLRPEIIDDLGLEAAIEWYTKEFADRTGIAVVHDMEYGIKISSDHSLTLFRIMQESLTNIARHSGATKVEIGLHENGATVNFRISDNGTGITEAQIKSKKSFGILSMKERTSSLGGNFDICCDIRGGTVIKIIFPLKTEKV
jgi:PAS domain S-box-containing protein